VIARVRATQLDVRAAVDIAHLGVKPEVYDTLCDITEAESHQEALDQSMVSTVVYSSV
jgi:hypothetical protein